MKKVCIICRKSKDVNEFSKSSRYADGRQVCCKSCQHIYYLKNKKNHIRNVRIRRDRICLENRAKMLEYLKNKKCFDCGIVDPEVMEFDHVRGKKKKEISILMHNGCSWRTIEEEIKKCEVRCANCHRRKTVRERGWFKGCP